MQSSTPQDFYVANLKQEFGYPLRTPEPNSRLGRPYIKEGLQIGDVGFVDDEVKMISPRLQPVMIALESVDTSEDGPPAPVEGSSFDAAFLSPPRRTFRAARSPPPRRPASAPPLTALPISSELSFSASSLVHFPHFMIRPTTFWRKTKQSGAAGASYSPSSHLIRWSTFIAAGLSLDKPEADLSALGVESRVQFIVLVPDYNPQ
ncbi:hypothetical protein EV363DRAFT_1588206 [Boletus edulis]|uniref:Uncharacterized protein n=1 Tax=Boletus edulis BED1 TaxID=1328754 RepID=A0AAD4G871_BOLED|nr:hypothetical protein EV363DRAFT_1588206 [Boletus edulis]KAF8426839.1 hypothetical protein L210DRAFT_3765184 [Boletus edulis BED1]